MTVTLANGYSSESTQRELSNEYQHDRDSMLFKKCCVLVLWMKVASALEGLTIAPHELKIMIFSQLQMERTHIANIENRCAIRLTLRGSFKPRFESIQLLMKRINVRIRL